MDTVVNHLQEFGLSSKEAEVFYALSRLGLGTGEDVCRATGLTRLQVYRSLNGLINRGLVEIRLDRPRKYVPLEIGQSIELLMQEMKMRLTELERKESVILQEWSEIPDLQQPIRKYTLRVIQGNKNVFRFGIRLYENAKTSIDIIAKGNGLAKAITLGIDDVLKECAEKGVTIRRISEISAQNIKSAKRFMEFGEFRHMPIEDLAQIVVVDNAEALLGFSSGITEPEINDENAIWTNHPELVGVLREFFNKAWTVAPDSNDVISRIKRKHPWVGAEPQKLLRFPTPPAILAPNQPVRILEGEV